MEFIKKIVICVIFLCASISNAAEFEVMDMLTVNGITHLKSSATIIVPDTVPSSIWISTSATTSHLYISTAGKVGIGTNSPSAKLTINTSIGNALLAMNDVGGTPAIYAYNSSIGAYGIRADAVGTGTKYGIYGRATGGGTNQAGLFTASGGTNNWGIYVTAGEAYFSDDVGIGIDAPTHKLHVFGGILATSSITASEFYGDASNLTNVPGDDLGNHVATTTLQMINFGINTSSDISAARYQING
ncbi:MAG: hypothetical protein KAI33_00315, partial [Elusimicrobiales bacterium]|nr:hypothetical protein [Elusimicrobiales bacterium]